MSCEEFEILVGDLASEHLTSAFERKSAVAHAYSCASCKARLANEQALNAALRVAASAETERAPARVGAALLEAFAELHSRSLDPLPALAPTRRVLWPRFVWAAAAAAVILFAAVSLMPKRSGDQKQSVSQGSTAPGSDLESNPNPKSAVAKPVERVAAHTEHQPVLRKARYGGRHLAARAKGSDELETDFIPLTYLADASALRSGQVVHVRVPRSTLISMGLAMNVDHANDLVEADLLLSDEGVAHGIRLHQKSNTNELEKQ
jgi:hypothetical protein